MEKQNNDNVQPAFALPAIPLPPIPEGKKLAWVNDTLTLVDAPEEPTIDNRPITERVKTFEDACAILGNHAFVNQYRRITEEQNPPMDDTAADLIAYLKLRIIAAALNEGWKPQFVEGECRWYPWFYFYTQEEIDEMTEERKKEISLLLWGGPAYSGSCCGLGYVHSLRAFSYSDAYCGSRLAVKSKELAEYFGRQFIEIWADYVFKPNVKTTEE